MSWCTIPPSWSFDETPKQRWKREQSWIRWKRRYGNTKQLFQGEVGRYEGVRFIKS